MDRDHVSVDYVAIKKQMLATLDGLRFEDGSRVGLKKNWQYTTIEKFTIHFYNGKYKTDFQPGSRGMTVYLIDMSKKTIESCSPTKADDADLKKVADALGLTITASGGFTKRRKSTRRRKSKRSHKTSRYRRHY